MSLYESAYIRESCIEDLKEMASPEDWDNQHIAAYLNHTFNRIMEEYDAAETEEDKQKKFSMSEEYACFNTGLVTENYSPIYMCLEKNQNENRQPWFCKGFFSSSVPNELKNLVLPERANYFTRPEELIYDYRLPIKVDVDHIFSDENIVRFPNYIRAKYSLNALRNLFNGAVLEAEKRLAVNYKLAVPQYFNGTFQLLVPIDLENKGSADVALTMFKAKSCYSARTCLTLEMAYYNARLIAKPEGWLQKTVA